MLAEAFVTAPIAAPVQFNISSHYDAMADLDRDVHDNAELSDSEVALALTQIGSVPKSLFLPCFGTGRHIPYFLAAGVEKIVGVDLSEACVSKANFLYGDDDRVELIVADLLDWYTDTQFDAVVLLGNSYADCIDQNLLARITESMVKPLMSGGKFLMDYIGANYLAKAMEAKSSVWEAQLWGQAVFDCRIPSYEPSTSVMTIDVSCTKAEEPDELVWKGFYQKLILSREEVATQFNNVGINLQCLGPAYELSRYVRNNIDNLGMIARSDWWIGTKGR